ncbi:hypothetical protein [Rhodopirellula bahusiensis]|uniref:hypothetical protein n=1 Tax=Rhodopirellula bahusiensis TaxID=2014065 RepID=UPI0013046108|nr:hypothetical protein [Rhodopirellula bahusiensis]
MSPEISVLRTADNAAEKKVVVRFADHKQAFFAGNCGRRIERSREDMKDAVIHLQLMSNAFHTNSMLSVLHCHERKPAKQNSSRRKGQQM